MILTLTKRNRLLKTTPSPSGSGELGTSPFASLTTTPLFFWMLHSHVSDKTQLSGSIRCARSTQIGFQSTFHIPRTLGAMRDEKKMR